jgi:DNA polymerase I-like protein with 3'-5' exonuclease and polymerase domains
LQIGYDEAKERKKNPEDLELYHCRQVGKAFNFGCMGGGGTDTLKEYAWNNYEVKLTYEEADRARTIWYQTYPEARPYFQLVSRECSEDLPLEHLFSGRLRGGTNFTSRANSRFQGLGGDAAKAAGWAVSEACYVDKRSVLYGSRPCVFVHDELGLLIPEAKAQEGVKELDRLMVSAAKVFIPDVAVKTEGVLSRVWSKKAKWKEGEKPWDIQAA